MVQSRAQLHREKMIIIATSRDRIAHLEDTLKEREKDIRKLTDDFSKSDRMNKALLAEREKMRQRFVKLKNRRFMDKN